MDRIFNLSRLAKIVIVLAILFFLALAAISIYVLITSKVETAIITATVGLFSSVGPAFLFAIVFLFIEKYDNIAIISRSTDNFIRNIIPGSISGRFIGDPFDLEKIKHLDVLHCRKLHKKGQPHAGYQVECGEQKFEFSCIINTYRMTIFFYMPYEMSQEQERYVDDACEGMINSGFRLRKEQVSSGAYVEYDHTVIYLRKDFETKERDLIFSHREQYFIAREISEWCRTVIRKMRYEQQQFTPLRYPCKTF
ncbi:MAG: hypothetical protein ACLP7P_04295 [Rhodomicrobium sp.]